MINYRRFTAGMALILPATALWGFAGCGTLAKFILENLIPVGLAIVALWFFVSLAMAFLPCSGFHHRVICRGKTKDRCVSVTFDDGPDPVATKKVLDILGKYDLRAAFFCIGKNIIGNEQLLERMDKAGHIIGNHSFTHSKWFDLFSPARMTNEIRATDRLIAGITGKAPQLFRPPYGVVNPMVDIALRKVKLRAVDWDIRSYDTVTGDPEKIIRRIMRKLKPGSIILLHDHTAFTDSHLEILIQGIMEAGYRIIPLEKMLNLPENE